jgi:hypothetical protein
MARLQTTIEPFTLVQGHRQTQPWIFRLVEPVANSPQAVAKGNLYVLLELGGEQPATPRLYRLLLNTIQGVYYDAAGGITGGLTEAILALHHTLEQHNQLYPQEEQRGGVSCVVLRGEELTLGMGGPAMTLVGHPGRVEQFPAELSSALTPLGGSEAPVIEIFRTSVDKQATVVQLQSEWAARLPSRKLAAAALAPDLATALEYLESLAPDDVSLSALVMQMTPRPVESAAPAPAAVVEALPDEAVVGAEATVAETSAQTTSETLGEPVAAASAAGEPSRKHRRVPWFLLLLIPIVLTAIVAGAYWWQQREIKLQVETLLQGAQAALQAANEEGAPEETARQQLADAQERIDEVLRLQPANQQALDLQAPVEEALARVNRVVPVYKLVTLREFGGPDSDPYRVVVQGSRVYVLDRGVDQVYRYGLDEVSGLIPETGEGIAVQRGMTLPDGQVVGELIDAAWAPAGGARRSSNLLVLDSNNNILQVDDTLGAQALSVGGRELWQAPRLISSYNGNLYVLDVGAGRIWRYLPTEDGYSGQPESYFADDATLDLSRVVDMAIDGNIWLLYSDGTVQTFFAGGQQPFELETPPTGPLTQPQAIHVGSEAGTAQTLFILDSGVGRILEYAKDGKYQRQFLPADTVDREKWRQARDLQVEEIDSLFYILTSSALLQTDIPQ